MKKFLTGVLVISVLSMTLFMSCKSIPIEKNLTDSVVILPSGTEGTGGTDKEYVLFGDWPQTVKADYVIIDESRKAVVNGWTCYEGSDGCLYVREESHCSGGGKFSNGYDIEDKKTYYFKMEPVKWRVLADKYGNLEGRLLLSERVLDASFFYPEWDEVRTINNTDVYVNNYLYSHVRAYLNGLDGRKFNVEDYSGKGFIDKAFSQKAREELVFISTVGMEVDLYLDYDVEQFSEYELYEKVFLLSENDIVNSDYSFGDYDECGKDSPRLRRATDYAKAMGADVTNDYNGCPWWLRSPSELSDEEVREVSSDGYAYNQTLVTNESEGIVPAVFIY